MADEMPVNVEVQERGDVVRYRLPRRQVGPWRWVGLVPLIFGLGFTGFALQWMLLADIGGGWMTWLFVAFGVPFLVIGLMGVVIGVLVIDSRSEIELSRGRLRACDTNGWLRWPRKRAVERIRRFVVSGPGKQGESVPGVLQDLAAIQVEADDPKQNMLMAIAYPRESLRWIAEDLARRCQCESAVLTGKLPAQIEVVEKDVAVSEPVFPDRVSQPVDSDAVVTEQPDGISIHLPAPGLRNQKGLFVFGLIWTGFVLMIAVPMAVKTIQKPGNNDWVGVAVTSGLFLPIGIGLILGGLHLARRACTLTIDSERLQILQTGLLGPRQEECLRREIADVRVDVYMTDDDGKPTNQLEIHLHDGKKLNCLHHRGDEELAWLATRLRQALALQPRRPGEQLPFVEIPTQPIESDVVREKQADGVTLNVPPAGIWGGSKGLFTFSLIWIGFMVLFDGLLLFFAAGDIGFMMLPFLAFSLLFWAIGIAMLLGAVNMGRRRAVLAVVRDRLLIMQTGLFGGQRHDWHKDEITDVRTGPSGMKINNVPVLELHIVTNVGKPTGLLCGRNHRELAWLATELRHALGVPRPEATANDAESVTA